MITNFCDFCLFSTKKLAFSFKTNDMIQFLHNFAVNNAVFRNFLAKIFYKPSVPVLEPERYIFFKMVPFLLKLSKLVQDFVKSSMFKKYI
jgi:hypothetical protein